MVQKYKSTNKRAVHMLAYVIGYHKRTCYCMYVVETDLFRLHVRNFSNYRIFSKHSAFLIKHHFDSPIIVISQTYFHEQ